MKINKLDSFGDLMKINKDDDAKKSNHEHQKFEDESSKIEDYENKINELSNQLNELKEKYLRALSDYDNLKKRTQKEIANSKELGKLEFFSELLPFIDSIDSARK
ncbi:MAG: nucleotide exchange factor GrpE, partial [Leptospiraceae bacterium]|nr:nucleotide exchange factor GrpE [Leptospiraceae bacterium]